MDPSLRHVLKALGDETRLRIWLMLREHDQPQSISSIAEQTNLHPNTVRPHLERLREANLVKQESDARGTVGRPQHRYRALESSLEESPSAPAMDLLADVLARTCAMGKVPTNVAVEIGRSVGRQLAEDSPVNTAGEILDNAMGKLGFDPAAVDEQTVHFESCPYQELAETHPEYVCGIHQGMISGILELYGETIHEFHSVNADTPCTMRHGAKPASATV